MRKKLGLALGAGGSRGVAHVGFLKALEEEGIKADFVTGCSMGAIVGACYSAGVPVDTIKEKTLSLKLSSLAALNINPFRMNGLMKMTKAREILGEVIGEKTFDELEIPFACVATDLIGGKLVVLKEGVVADAALASGSIPGVFTPASFGKYEMLVDGCILERVPTREVKEMGAEVIIAVDVLGNLPQTREATGKLINTVLRCFDIIDTAVTRKRQASRRYVDLLIEPELGDMDQYKVKDLDFAYEKGYEIAKKEMPKIVQLLE